MKYIGIFLFCLALFLYSRERINAITKRREELSFFLNFLGHVKREVSVFARPIPKACASFALRKGVGGKILSLVSEGEDLSSAYRRLSGELSLSKDEGDLLDGLFLNLGASYLSESVNQLSLVEDELSRRKDAYELDAPKKIRLTQTLAATACIGLIIAVI